MGSYWVDYVTSADQEIPDWLVENSAPREGETTVRLGSKSRWGLAKVTPFGSVVSF